MLMFICDRCGKHEAPQHPYTLPPDGWYSLRRHTGTREEVSFCSTDCLAHAVQVRVLAETTVTEATEATEATV